MRLYSMILVPTLALVWTLSINPAEPGQSDDQSANCKSLRAWYLPDTPYRYADVELLPHFQTWRARRFDNMSTDKPVMDAGATLGRVLFYETRLSLNNTISCGSCHVQACAFADPKQYRVGHEGKLTDRNSMRLVELRSSPRGRFFWDERARSLEEQVLMPIESKTEMGHDLVNLVAILSRDLRYHELYNKAFGDPEIPPARTARALAEFLPSMVLFQSKYDDGRMKAQTVRQDFENFTPHEDQGKTLFLANCANCHMPEGQDAHFFPADQ